MLSAGRSVYRAIAHLDFACLAGSGDRSGECISVSPGWLSMESPSNALTLAPTSLQEGVSIFIHHICGPGAGGNPARHARENRLLPGSSAHCKGMVGSKSILELSLQSIAGTGSACHTHWEAPLARDVSPKVPVLSN